MSLLFRIAKHIHVIYICLILKTIIWNQTPLELGHHFILNFWQTKLSLHIYTYINKQTREYPRTEVFTYLSCYETRWVFLIKNTYYKWDPVEMLSQESTLSDKVIWEVSEKNCYAHVHMLCWITCHNLLAY